MNSEIKLFGRFATAVLALVLVSSTAFAGSKSAALKAAAATPVNVTLQNPSFESPKLAYGDLTKNVVPGWNLLPGSYLGVWNPYHNSYVGLPWDGKNILWIISGGVNQQLPLRLQGLADYSFSMEWGSRTDFTGAYVELQFVAGGQVLASCAPPFSPKAGHTATITLVYHSDGSSPQVGQPMSIQVVKLDQPTYVISNTVYGNLTQANLDDAQVTFTDLAGTPASAFTVTQECSINIAQ